MYFGVKNGNLCFCGENGLFGVKDEAEEECNVTRCPADNSQFCGGDTTMTVLPVEKLYPETPDFDVHVGDDVFGYKEAKDYCKDVNMSIAVPKEQWQNDALLSFAPPGGECE